MIVVNFLTFCANRSGKNNLTLAFSTQMEGSLANSTQIHNPGPTIFPFEEQSKVPHFVSTCHE